VDRILDSAPFRDADQARTIGVVERCLVHTLRVLRSNGSADMTPSVTGSLSTNDFLCNAHAPAVQP
jgi:hypothetical protein